MKSIRSLKIFDSYYSISLFMILPSILLSISLIVGLLYYNNSFRSLTQQNSTAALQNLYEKCEHDINTSIALSKLISDQSVQVDFSDEAIYNTDYISLCKNELDHSLQQIPLADSIIIYNAEKSYVFCSGGYMPASEFFGNQYVYESYNTDYWNNLKILSGSRQKTLLPTTVKTDKHSKNILTVIFSKSGNNNKQYFLVNLDVNKIFQKNFSDLSVDNEIGILNNFTRQTFFYNTASNGVTQKYLDDSLYNLFFKHNSFFDYTDKSGNNFFVSTYSTSATLVGYTYFCMVPKSVINRMMYPQIIAIVLSLFIILAIILFIIKKANKSIISPLKKIENMISDSGNSLSGTFSSVENSLTEMITQKSNYDAILPLAQEKYLISYLVSNNIQIDETTRAIIKNTLPFDGNYFAAVIIHLYPTDKLLKYYSTAEYSNIKVGFFNIVKSIFTLRSKAILLQGDDEKLNIIVNFKTPDDSSCITGCLDEIKSFLKNDYDLLDFYVGVGKIYCDFEGLKRSYLEASEHIKLTPVTRLTFSEYLSSNKSLSSFSVDDENKLYNLLSALEMDSAIETIHNLFKRAITTNNEKNTDIYCRILMNIFKAMNTNHIPYHKNGETDWEIISDIVVLPKEECEKKIFHYINIMKTYSGSETVEDCTQDIIDYINTNYVNPDLCLDMISKAFNVKSNYVSQILKPRLGTGFYDYITKLRIDKAKQLLKNKDKAIVEIYQEAGFSSKQTFFRTFKKYVGVTPNTYRSNKFTV